MDWPLTIYVLIVVAISFSYWLYRQKRAKRLSENNKEENSSPGT